VRGLSGLFIPGIPTLTTGILLFIASITDSWHIWGVLWPLEVISLALGFVLMAIILNIPWLMIPASIIGLTGVVLQFCAITTWWNSWAVLWTVEPFAVGLPLLLIGIFKKIERVKVAGIILCGFAGLAFAAMSSILVTSLWITRLIGPAIVLGLGLLMVFSAFVKQPVETKNFSSLTFPLTSIQSLASSGPVHGAAGEKKPFHPENDQSNPYDAKTNQAVVVKWFFEYQHTQQELNSWIYIL
jgi:hypothetical protein